MSKNERFFGRLHGKDKYGRYLSEEALSQEEKDLRFAMESNGFVLNLGNEWKLNQKLFEKKKLDRTLLSLTIGFGHVVGFDHGRDCASQLAENLQQKAVLTVISRYRELDEVAAERISLALGSFICHVFREKTDSELANSVDFIAQMTNLGGRKSGEAISCAMSAYRLSDESFSKVGALKENVFRMAEAIEEDPVVVQDTPDLGLSQALRLKKFIKKIQKTEDRDKLPPFTTKQYKEVFSGFPTIGAEFHIPESDKLSPNFWQRVAILNMAQYQRYSWIPFSRDERGLAEIRMNPSIYPVSIANWNLARLLLPELNQSYFTLTINRQDSDFNHTGIYGDDKQLIKNLHSLGSLCYGAFCKDTAPTEKSEEIDFGDYYLGQTVRVKNGQFDLTGQWNRRSEGSFGQLNIYTGFGNSFPKMAYYSSMALVEPKLFEPLGKYILQVESAVYAQDDYIRNTFGRINSIIMDDPRLREATECGQEIIDQLNP